MTTDDALGRERRIWDPILFLFFSSAVERGGGEERSAKLVEIKLPRFLRRKPRESFSLPFDSLVAELSRFASWSGQREGKGGGIGFAVSRNSRFIDSKSIDSRASESRAKY